MLAAVEATAWGHLGFFLAIGGSAAWLMARLDRRWRQILFWGSVIPLFGYGFAGGLSLSLLAGALALCFAYVQLRFASPDVS